MPLQSTPLISIIIPCYNHGTYLKQAVESVRTQDVSEIEIIVIDDGSTDDTPKISKELDVIYIRQKNSGLSSARNTGIKHSNGDFLVFLDADDWLLPGALQTNANYLLNNNYAFVSGAHLKVFVELEITREESTVVVSDHYERLLQGNYIGMHAAVMYNRWIFDHFLFDTSLHMCEDYDIYLKVTRKYPVIHHTETIAAYRLHDNNMSGNIPKMLNSAIKVLKRQSNFIETSSEKMALSKGIDVWKNYYTKKLIESIKTKDGSLSIKHLFFFFRYDPILGLKLLLR